MSLRPAIEENRETRGYSFSAQNLFRSVTSERYKLIHDLESESSRLYDLREDPREQVDIAAREVAAVEDPKARLFGWLREFEGIESASDLERARNIARETAERLRTIGYVE